MKGSNQVGPSAGPKLGLGVLVVLAVALVTYGAPAPAQINGVAPSVTSIPMSHFLPNPRPSVTSLGPFGYGPRSSYNVGGAPNIYKYPYHQFPYTRTRGYGRGGYGYGGYSVPYYLPYDTSGYGYDYVAGSDLYSGPPIGPNDPTLHIVVEQPPIARRDLAEYPQPEAVGPADSTPAAAPRDDRPVEPTVLVFRDGHKQEVSNYAIMGQVVYVFDDHAKKIALADLDVPATIKANDDRGLEFKLPPPAPVKKKDSHQNTPASDPSKPSSVAALALP